MGKISLIIMLMGVPFASLANLACSYYCDTHTALKDAAYIVSAKGDFTPECVKKCRYDQVDAYYHELLSHLALSEQDNIFKTFSLKLKNITPPDTMQNNKLHELRATFDIGNYLKHGKLMSPTLAKVPPSKLQISLKRLMDVFKADDDAFCSHSSQKHTNTPVTKNKSYSIKKLFDWCENYCVPDRAPMTYMNLKTYISNHKHFNTAEYIDKISNPNFSAPFSHFKEKQITRMYKCLNNCPTEKSKYYMCVLIDKIDLNDNNDTVSPKMLHVFAEIMLRTRSLKNPKQDKLYTFLKNEALHQNCEAYLDQHHPGPHNYSNNIAYLKDIYLN